MGNQESSNYQNYAYRVMKIFEEGPSHETGLQEFVDFILYNPEANNNVLFSEFLLQNCLKEVDLKVYNMIRQEVRNVKIIPKKINDNNYLGAQIRFEKFDDVSEKVFLVEQVQKNSPAEQAGLCDPQIGGKDFIILLNTIVVQDLDEFSDILKASDGKEVEIVVYNTQAQFARALKMIPSSAWGGQGLVGCQIDFGVLHKIPKPKKGSSLSITLQKVKQIEEEETPGFNQDDVQDKEQDKSNPDNQEEIGADFDSKDYEETKQSYLKQEVQKQQQKVNQEVISDSDESITHDDNELLDMHKVIPKNNYSYVKTDLDSKQQRFNDIQDNNRDQTIIFHRSDGKNQQFLLINA